MPLLNGVRSKRDTGSVQAAYWTYFNNTPFNVALPFDPSLLDALRRWRLKQAHGSLAVPVAMLRMRRPDVPVCYAGTLGDYQDRPDVLV